MKRYIRGHRIEINKRNALNAWKKLFSEKKINNMIFRFSTSIQNFADRVKGRYDIEEWHPVKSLFKPTVFLGVYHEGDWLRVLLHRGPRLIFYCGGDILRLEKKPLWQWLIKLVKADHVCENGVEQMALLKMGIYARIHPILFFDDHNNYSLSYKHSNNPHVWLTCHPGREREYGVELVEEIANEVPEVNFHIFGINKPFHEPWFDPISGELMNLRHQFNKNVFYYGQIPSEKLDKMIRNYQCGLRTLEFDGCSHTVTKGVLLGQWPINRIPYPHTESYETKEELIKLLKNLKNKKTANIQGRKHWKKVVEEYPWS